MIELRPEQRGILLDLFQGIRDSVIISCLQGNMGRAWADSINSPRLGMIFACEYCFVTGDERHPEAEGLAANIHRLTDSELLYVISDNNKLLELTEKKNKEHCKYVTRYHMLNKNDTSEHLAHLLGYEMTGSYKCLEIHTPHTEYLGGIVSLIGSPVSHSKSPMLFNEAFKRDKLDYIYTVRELVSSEEVRAFFEEMRAGSDLGCNVTMPWKQLAAELMDELSDTAELTGSVNTVVNRNGQLTGYSTDGSGLVNKLKEAGISIENSTIVILGAGGAARSIIAECALSGAHMITVVCRDGDNKNRTQSLVEALKCRTNTCNCFIEFKSFEDYSLSKADILINCTPIGMKPNDEESPITNPALLHTNLVVADAVYNPAETVLLKQAAKQGCKTVEGLAMLHGQAVEGYRLICK